MSSFSDNFQRADGPLGANWYPNGAQPHISGGRPITNSNGYVICQAITDAGAQSATVTLDTTATSFLSTRVVVKSDGTGTGSYIAYLTGTSGAYTANIGKHAGSDSSLGTASFPSTLPNPTTITLTYNGGTLSFYVNGVMVAWARDNSNDANTHTGFYFLANVQPVVQFDTVMAPTAAFSVSPTQAQKGGNAVLLTLTGQNTAWTAGNPGTPTFTVSTGSLSGQVVQGASSAQVWYTPPGSGTTAVVTDPSTSLTATIYLTTGPVLPPGGPVADPWLEDGGTLVHNTMNLNSPDWLFTDRSVIFPAVEGVNPDVDVVTVIQDIWHQLYPGRIPGSENPTSMLNLLWQIANGAQAWENGNDILANAILAKANAGAAVTALTALTSTGAYNLASVISTIAGSSGYDLTTLLANIPAADVSGVLADIAALRGDEAATVAQVLADLDELVTEGNYSLASVKGWIEAAQGTNTPTIHDVLAKLTYIQPSNIVSLSTILDAVVSSATITNIVNVAIAALAGEEGLTLAGARDSILDVLDNLQTPASGATTRWPGEDNVTLGESLELLDGVEVPGPLNGLLITIDGQPAHTQRYMFGDVSSWARCGQAIFATDRGDYERSQTFGLDRQILVPTTMELAASAIVRVNSGWEGTVTPWTINSP